MSDAIKSSLSSKASQPLSWVCLNRMQESPCWCFHWWPSCFQSFCQLGSSLVSWELTPRRWTSLLRNIWSCVIPSAFSQFQPVVSLFAVLIFSQEWWNFLSTYFMVYDLRLAHAGGNKLQYDNDKHCDENSYQLMAYYIKTDPLSNLVDLKF